MTLREIRASWPDLFYPRQDWFNGEAFLAGEHDESVRLPDAFAPNPAPNQIFLPNAATLAGLYVTYPKALIWQSYLWTSDLDSLGQRVYVGSNGKGLEIHRHLHITERWGTAVGL